MSPSFVQAMQKKDSRTENGMLAHSTSSNACVDLFFQIGAMRDWNMTPQQRLSALAWYLREAIAIAKHRHAKSPLRLTHSPT